MTTTKTTMIAAPRAPHRGSARHSRHKLQCLPYKLQNQTVPSEFFLITIISSCFTIGGRSDPATM